MLQFVDSCIILMARVRSDLIESARACLFSMRKCAGSAHGDVQKFTTQPHIGHDEDIVQCFGAVTNFMTCLWLTGVFLFVRVSMCVCA